MPELKGGLMYQSGRGEGANAKAAISRAFGNALRKVKGKRISIIKAQITLTTKADNEVLEQSLKLLNAGWITPGQVKETA